MRTALKISICLNFALLGGLILLLANQRRQTIASAPASSVAAPAARPTPVPASASPPGAEPQSFRWSQLASGKDYRAYIANLRAIGCPEPTIEDIVRGDTDRTFSWERNQLGLDGSGDGPWSRSRERQLVANLLGGQTIQGGTLAQNSKGEMSESGDDNEAAGTSVLAASAASQTPATAVGGFAENSARATGAEITTPAYPLFLQNVKWSALGFSADQESAIAQVRQQFLNQINGASQNSGGSVETSASAANSSSDSSTSLAQWQNALQSADDELRGLLGAQGYMAYEQQQYYAWYQPQVTAANASGEHLTINPDAFSLK
jgi:hypothetical protein